MNIIHSLYSRHYTTLLRTRKPSHTGIANFNYGVGRGALKLAPGGSHGVPAIDCCVENFGLTEERHSRYLIKQALALLDDTFDPN